MSNRHVKLSEFRFTGRSLDLVCFFFVIVVAINAVVLLVEGTPQYFQRFGSFMVASAIAFYFIDKAKYRGTDVEYGNVFRFPLVATVELGVKVKIPSVFLIEGILLFLGTLVWGYGDLFHCWANDNGWDVCY